MVPCNWCGQGLHEVVVPDDRRPAMAAREAGNPKVYNFHRACWDLIMRLHEVPPKAQPQTPQQTQQQAQPGVHRVPPGLRPPGQR